ncbi:hypothetical protein Cch01nite_23910 [Cellulomonas chitinilytica]|uniref:DUF2510 domain-containing protein n=1 Tax=Cellulomonas chitinilytica TaxID=398759 RepID=A0A919U2P1_9CELL|nr:DUF2510 domain-containing protein [Cellulomonas chitinilytica]GIG21667.1 hypothetical protein Cch01nite_23910 [Cellulomonas chitinilytica]
MHVPGWYPDPSVPGQERWWGGQSFTAHVRPSPAGAPAAAPAATAVAAMPTAPPVCTNLAPAPLTWSADHAQRLSDVPTDLASGRNPRATAALVLGILSVFGFWIGAILGIVLGVQGLSRAGAYAAAGHPAFGRTKSVWALVLSGVGVLVSVAIIAAAL